MFKIIKWLVLLTVLFGLGSSFASLQNYFPSVFKGNNTVDLDKEFSKDSIFSITEAFAGKVLPVLSEIYEQSELCAKNIDRNKIENKIINEFNRLKEPNSKINPVDNIQAVLNEIIEELKKCQSRK